MYTNVFNVAVIHLAKGTDMVVKSAALSETVATATASNNIVIIITKHYHNVRKLSPPTM